MIKYLTGFLLFLWQVAAAQEASQSDSIIHFEVRFDLDSDRLSLQEKEKVDSVFFSLPQAAITRIEVFGHTDSLADLEYNKELSKRRVQGLISYFMYLGIDPLLLKTEHYGEERPLYDNSPAERYKNRRVEVQVALNPALLPEPEKRFSDNNFEKGALLRIPNLNFVGNQAVPTWESFPALQELLWVMNLNPDLEIELQGHVCCSNDMELSQARARMVYQFLLANGISASRMGYQGFSNDKPLYREIDERSKSLNRRVEMLVLSNTDRKDATARLADKIQLEAPIFNVLFSEGSARLIPTGDFNLGLVAEMIKESEGLFFEVLVYDNIEDARLTASRASAIRRAFNRKGVGAKLLKVSHEKAPPWMPRTDNLNAVMLKIRSND
jgi:outer membrane protein OmpA-like peptidoglycan-associated protein